MCVADQREQRDHGGPIAAQQEVVARLGDAREMCARCARDVREMCARCARDAREMWAMGGMWARCGRDVVEI